MSQVAYKYRIYPNKEQAEFLAKNFGCVRFIWNLEVANFIKNGTLAKEDRKNLVEKEIKAEHVFLQEVISYTLQQKRRDFDEYKSQFFSKSRKKAVGRPKFKKKGVSRDSFRIPGAQLRWSTCQELKSGLKLPKMSPMKIIIDRKFTGKVINITISKNRANQHFVSILTEEEKELYPVTNKSIGIDLGLTHLAVLSDGTKIDNPKWFRESQSKLAEAQRHLARKMSGSNRRDKQRLKVAKIHLYIANQRKWMHHNLSSYLVKNYNLISMEKLNVTGMVKNKKLSKSISDASWSSLVSMIAYKSNWRGRSFVQVDRFYPSSKTCSSCGHVVDKMDLSVRSWTCPSCFAEHDRDINAAINIRSRGLKDLYSLTSAESVEYIRGEVVRPELDVAIYPVIASLMKRRDSNFCVSGVTF